MKLKVISLNLWLGGILFDNVIQFLREQDADIVLLQEVFNGTEPTLERRFRSMQVLKEMLDYPYEDFAAAYRDFDLTNGLMQRGDAILSKFPIKERHATFLSGGYSETYRDVPEQYKDCPRELEHVVIETPDGDLNVFNLQGVWDLNGDNFSEARKKMAEVILTAVKGKQHVILGGDTNARPTNKAIQMIEGELINVFKDTLISTFNMRHKDNPGYATSAVDMLFVTPDIEVVSRDCPDVDVSDHMPLVIEIALK